MGLTMSANEGTMGDPRPINGWAACVPFFEKAVDSNRVNSSSSTPHLLR